MRKKGIIFLTLSIFLLFIAGYYLYSEFHGDPITKYFAILKINNYINDNYPEKNLKIDSVHFEFKPKAYVADVYSETDDKVTFQIGIKKGGTKIFLNEYIDKYAKDYDLSERFANTLKNRITKVLRKKLPQLSEVMVVLYIEKGKYPKDTEYSTQINEPYSVILEFRGEQIYKHEFVALCYEAKETLKEQGFIVDSYIFDYRGHDSKDKGGLGYSLELSNDQLAYSEQEMLMIENLSVYGDEDIQKKYGH